MSWFSNLFGRKKKDEGTVAAPVIPRITDYPIGSTIEERILAALRSGQNIGYPEEFVSRTTSPLVASREAGFRESELPFLNAQYGGRGLSRSTLAARDVGKAFATKERDINEIIANAYAMNEAQKKTDIARYENLGYDFSGTQQGIGERQAQADYGANIYNTRVMAANKEANNQALLKALGIGTAIAAAPFTGGTSLAAIPGMLTNSSGGVGWTSVVNMATAAQNATPFTKTVTNYGGGATGTTQPYYLSSRWGGRG